MTLARLLAAALLLCSLSAFAQDQPNGGPTGQNPFFRFEANGRHSGYVYCGHNSSHTEDFFTVGSRSYVAHFEDTMCYAIRNYLVARDSQDSDSTHPAGYSTCQPAARYQLKTTEIRSADR